MNKKTDIQRKLWRLYTLMLGSFNAAFILLALGLYLKLPTLPVYTTIAASFGFIFWLIVNFIFFFYPLLMLMKEKPNEAESSNNILRRARK